MPVHEVIDQGDRLQVVYCTFPPPIFRGHFLHEYCLVYLRAQLPRIVLPCPDQLLVMYRYMTANVGSTHFMHYKSASCYAPPIPSRDEVLLIERCRRCLEMNFMNSKLLAFLTPRCRCAYPLLLHIFREIIGFMTLKCEASHS